MLTQLTEKATLCQADISLCLYLALRLVLKGLLTFTLVVLDTTAPTLVLLTYLEFCSVQADTYITR